MSNQPDITDFDHLKDDPLSALAWLIDMGVDEVIGEETIDWFAREDTPPPTIKPSGKLSAKPSAGAPHIDVSNKRLTPSAPVQSAARAVSSSDNLIEDARKLAGACKTIDDLITTLGKFEGCSLSRTATNLSFIDGNVNADILIIDESPGREEDLQGKPLVGRSGQLLDKMIGHIGLSRSNETPISSVLVSNLVFWRPPGNRKPTDSETMMCVPFINKLIEITSPKIIVCLGAMTAQRLTGQSLGIQRLRGRWFEYQRGDKTIPVLCSLRPAFLLNQPAQKVLAWQDLINLKLKLLELG